MSRLQRRLVLVVLAALLIGGCASPQPPRPAPGDPATNETPGDPSPPPTDGPSLPRANATRLLALVDAQVHHQNATPRYRTPGTPGHAEAKDLLRSLLEARNLTVERQDFQVEIDGLGTVDATNLYGVRPGTSDHELWLAAHWDSRAWADEDPDPANHDEPVLGANDGAAAVAVVLHALDLLGPTDHTIRVALFDVEDQGGNGRGWALGSQHAADQLSQEHADRITAMVLVDMPGDEHLELRREGYSDSRHPALVDLVFGRAEALGAPAFINRSGPAILDDHVALLERGVPAVDLIHLDDETGPGQRGVFPSTHHTVADTMENLSGPNMAQVTEVVVASVQRLDQTDPTTWR